MDPPPTFFHNRGPLPDSSLQSNGFPLVILQQCSFMAVVGLRQDLEKQERKKKKKHFPYIVRSLLL